MDDLHKLLNKRVRIRHTTKSAYLLKDLVGRFGFVSKVRTGNGDIFGIRVDEKVNPASEYGVFWFHKSELDFVTDESEGINMIPEGYEFVAKVHLLEDSQKRDYYFALYSCDLDMIHILKTDEYNKDGSVMVVVNPRGRNNRVLGQIKDIIPIEAYSGSKPTAEVVGIVNMHFYNSREAEKDRLAELAKKKAAIEEELEKEINKRKSVEYYEEMAAKYSDNPKLAELVAELKSLGEGE